MNDEFSDELISAFLDGELTAEEQARVEQLLIDSAEHRQMFQELRTLRSSLQSMPTYTLGEDFPERVLRQAERAMLTGPTDDNDPTSDTAQSVGVSKPTIVNLPSPSDAAGNWKTAVFAVITVAAALVFSIVYFPGVSDDDSNVATTGSIESSAAPDEKAPLVAQEAADGSAREQTSPDDRENFRRDLDVSNNPAADATPAVDKSLESNPFAAPERESVEEKSPRTPKIAGKKSGGANVPQPPREGQQSFGAPGAALDGKSNGSPKPPAPTSPTAGAAKFAKSAPNLAQSNRADGRPADDRYVILADFTRKAFESRAFDRTLARNGIAIHTTKYQESKEALAGPAGRALTTPAPNTANTTLRNDDPNAGKNLDVIIVEGTLTQIKDVCRDLSKDNHLLAMTVHSESEENQPLLYRSIQRQNANLEFADRPQLNRMRRGSSGGDAGPPAKSAPAKSPAPAEPRDEKGDSQSAKKAEKPKTKKGPVDAPKRATEPSPGKDAEKNVRNKSLPADKKKLADDRSKLLSEADKAPGSSKSGFAVRLPAATNEDGAELKRKEQAGSDHASRRTIVDSLDAKQELSKRLVEEELRKLGEGVQIKELAKVRANADAADPSSLPRKVRVVFVIRAIEPSAAAVQTEPPAKE